jgi:hypothetical protein
MGTTKNLNFITPARADYVIPAKAGMHVNQNPGRRIKSGRTNCWRSRYGNS